MYSSLICVSERLPVVAVNITSDFTGISNDASIDQRIRKIDDRFILTVQSKLAVNVQLLDLTTETVFN
jgi:hypothetical protein